MKHLHKLRMTGLLAALVSLPLATSGQLVSLFLETFDAGETAESVERRNIVELGWNVHHSHAGAYMPGRQMTADSFQVFLTNGNPGDFALGQPFGYVDIFINDRNPNNEIAYLYGQNIEGDRPELPGPHPETGLYYHNRTLAVFLWKEHVIPAAQRPGIQQFNFVQGNRDAQYHQFFPAVRIGGQWYVYRLPPEALQAVRILGRPSQNGMYGEESVFVGDQFSEGDAYNNYYNAQPYVFTWSESGWTPLTFNGGAGTDSTAGMVLGEPLEGDLPAGDITAVGVFSPENLDPFGPSSPGYNFNGYRIDSIQILAEEADFVPPTITQQPASLTRVAGETAQFSVAVLETEGISYQWRKGGEDIEGAADATLLLQNVTLADAGSYTVQVTGPQGFAVSEAATLTVYPQPVVDPLVIEADAAGQDDLILVDAVAQVEWTATSTVDWIVITYGATGTGGDFVLITIAPNPGAPRSGTMLVAGATVTVNQDGEPLPVFKLNAYQFEQDYELGSLNGQNGWASPAAAVVTDATFSYLNPEGLEWTGGARALELPGSTAAPINAFAVRGIDSEKPDQTFYISYHAMVSDNGTDDPSELFVRNAGWSLFSALKVTADAFEVNGTQYTPAGLEYDTPAHVVLEAVMEGGVITTVRGWLNPVKDTDPVASGDQKPAPQVTVTGLSLSPDALTGFELRSQKARSVVDDLVITEQWAECFWLRQVRLAVVPTLGANVQFEGMEDLIKGAGASPHDPEDEPPSVDSIPIVQFQGHLNLAYMLGIGGVVDFEPENVTVTSGLERPSASVELAKINHMVAALGTRDIHIRWSENNYAEGGCASGYTGKECWPVDFLEPSPPERPDRYDLWAIGPRANSASGTSGLGGTTRYELNFDPQDRLVKVGVVYVNWNNFQSHRATKPYPDKPNVRMSAVFTNGSEELVLLSTGLTEQTAEPYNTFFGFEAPEPGWYLARLELFTIGNNARLWAGLDDLALIMEAPVEEVTDLFTFTFNNEGKVDGLDRPIQAANWNGIYSSAALPAVTGEAIFADLSEGVIASQGEIPGAYKAGFLFVSGKNDQPAPEGFLLWSENTNVVNQPQWPPEGNPQTDWFCENPDALGNLNQILVRDLRELSVYVNPRNMDTVRYHFALQVAGEWYITEQAFQSTGDWTLISVNPQTANWLTGIVGEEFLNLDFDVNPPQVVTLGSLPAGALLTTVGIYIDTDDFVGQWDTWARIDSYMLTAALSGDIVPPTILEQPASLAVMVGETATFSVVVEETGVEYQWRKGGQDIEGATEATLVLENVQTADAGSYTVLVTGPRGAVTSEAATLTVYPLPVVDPLLIEAAAAGQDDFIFVDAVAEVEWTSESHVDWIVITYGETGAGGDIVLITIAPNPDLGPRTGTLTVAGATVTVNQAGRPLPSFEELVGAVDNGDGTWTSAWFGTYAPTDYEGWIRHREQGILWTGAVDTVEEFYLWCPALNSWIWSSEGIYPIVYDFRGEEFIFFLYPEGYGLHIYSYVTEEWYLPGNPL